jgi:TRAP-type mannitol/chloroaromatic compound transport system permease large subunit
MAGTGYGLPHLVALNLQMSFLTPPFGWAFKGASRPGVSSTQGYLRGALPFMSTGAGNLVFYFPTLATWPKVIIAIHEITRFSAYSPLWLAVLIAP